MGKPENFPKSPTHVWDQFYNITQIPRPSRHEDKMVEYLKSIAIENNLEFSIDDASNVIIKVPGRNGRENDEPVIIQNHIDMVTDATIDRKINFKTDPIETYVEDGWLRADRTTLGADNGIGCAAALATIFDDTIKNPPLELLFTTDEETGLNGALNLEVKNLKGKKMLNLDTEEWGSVYIGCAGGIDYELTGDLNFESVDGNGLKISLGNFTGGHSGLDIHEQRANAIKFLFEALGEITSDYRICEVRGGKAHNIIPRDAFVILSVLDVKIEQLIESVRRTCSRWKSYLPVEDQNFEITFEKVSLDSKKALSVEDGKRLVKLINLFPHGAHSFDLASNKELVSMSNNLAKLLIMNGKFYLQSSLRFFDREEIRKLELNIRTLAELFDLKVSANSEYPSWKPVLKNQVLDIVKNKYHQLFGKEMNVTAIHAGLECGILKDKIGQIDVVSFGPTIMGAHSPDERVDIESVEKFWTLFKGVLEDI